jgi:hypothetical protein
VQVSGTARLESKCCCIKFISKGVGEGKEKETNQQEGADQIGRDGIFISSLHLGHVRCKQLCGAQDVQYLGGKERKEREKEIEIGEMMRSPVN